jgi:hypothetical protein
MLPVVTMGRLHLCHTIAMDSCNWPAPFRRAGRSATNGQESNEVDRYYTDFTRLQLQLSGASSRLFPQVPPTDPTDLEAWVVKGNG